MRDDQIPCKICGERLTISNSEDWAMACSSLEEGPDGKLISKKGRSIADDHYSQSRMEFGNADNAEKYALRLTIARLREQLALIDAKQREESRK